MQEPKSEILISVIFRSQNESLRMSANPAASLKNFHDLEPSEDDFLGAVVAGLSKKQKTLPAKFFYDAAGSQLFDEICQLDEYYPTRTELGILEHDKQAMARAVGANCHLVEFGSGSSIKVRTLMKALEAPKGYVPIDISRDHLLQSATSFSADFPDIPVTAICADYTSDFSLPDIADGHYVGFYPGSTIGNFTPDEALAFLSRVRHKLDGGGLLIGVDLVKDLPVLNAAYDDAKGVTARFNKNILARSNRELGTGFDLAAFDHSAFFNPQDNRIEMHLVSNRDQLIGVADQTFSFAKGETIHTENSYKYTLQSFRDLATSAGFRPAHAWTDPQDLFSVHYLSAS